MTITLVPFHQDERLPLGTFPLPADAEIVTVAPELSGGDLWSRLGDLFEPVAAEIAGQIRRGAVPTAVSGDCLIAGAVLGGAQRAGVDASIVWFDAHGDVHTPESSTSGYLGGMALRQVLGDHPELATGRLGLRPLPEERAVLVDARDLDPAEADYLASAGIRRCGVEEAGPAVLPDGPVVLHIDVDVVDMHELPGLKFPVAGGPASAAVVAAARRLLATGRVAAVSIACPWHPAEGEAERIRARLLADLLP